MTGRFGPCGYFREYDHDLSEDERLHFAPGKAPPPYDRAQQPAPPAGEWNAARLAKANRNDAVEYIRDGVRELVNVLGQERALELAKPAARLTCLQPYRHMSDAEGGADGGPAGAANILAAMFRGIGNGVTLANGSGTRQAVVNHRGLRVVRGLDGDERSHLLAC